MLMPLELVFLVTGAKLDSRRGPAKYLKECFPYLSVKSTKTMRVRQKDVPYMTAEWKAAIRIKCRSAKQYNKK